jgi:hypothetical protein
VLSPFGLAAVIVMLVAYTLEAHSPWFVLMFAVACAAGSAYGFLQGGLAIRNCRSCVDDR